VALLMQINIEPEDRYLFAASTLRDITRTLDQLLQEIKARDDDDEWPEPRDIGILHMTLDLLDALKRAAVAAHKTTGASYELHDQKRRRARSR
jgi:hypothetical protein